MFTGSMVAIVTPMNKNGAIDFAAIARLIDMHIKKDTDAIIVAGTTGECATLTWQEQQELIKQTIKIVDGRIPVIAGTSANSTKLAIEKTRFAMKAGVDACLLMTPPYIKPTQEGLYQHFTAIAKAVAIPQILYNVPARTASDILPDTITRLADISNIIGIKEATGDMLRAVEIMQSCGDKIDVYSGDDMTALALLLLGGKGVISVTANVAPRLMAEMCAYALTGNDAIARKMNEKLLPLHKQLFSESNPIPTKWALTEMGLIENQLRLPLTPLSKCYQQPLKETLQSLQLL